MAKVNTFTSIMQSVAKCEHGDGCDLCCWLWTGQQDKKGYGKVSYMNRKYTAHNLIYNMHSNNGKYGMQMYTLHLHKCDTPLCCNWNHIYIGTHNDNMRDKVERGRQVKGIDQVNAILNDTKVYQIRRNYYIGWKILELAYFFDVSMAIIERIVTYKDWKHLKGELIRRKSSAAIVT